MKHWQETRDILYRAAASVAAGRAVALATVVRIAGSAYRRPGAKLLIEPSGNTLGGVSGGCLEADVREIGRGVAAGGAPVLRRYETGADENTVWGLGMGCDGTVDVFVQAITATSTDLWNEVRRLLDGGEPFAISTVLSGDAAGRSIITLDGKAVAGTTGDGLLDVEIVRCAGAQVAARRSHIEDIETATVFTDVLIPPPWLVVCGAGDDAIPLVRLASSTGLRVAVADHRSAYLDAKRFPEASMLVEARAEHGLGELPVGSDCFGVVMTHSADQDREWVRHLLDSPVPYIGVLGPRTRVEKMLDELGVAGQKRVFGPIGVDIGADGPEQIAVSILAEILGVRSGRQPSHLRERKVAIHAV